MARERESGVEDGVEGGVEDRREDGLVFDSPDLGEVLVALDEGLLVIGLLDLTRHRLAWKD